MKKMNVLLSLGLLMAGQVFGQDIEFGEAALGGSGCTPGAASVRLRGTQVQVLAEALAYSETRGIKRLSCSLALPFTLAANKRLVLKSQRVQGYVATQGEAEARVSLEAFLSGGVGEKLQETWQDYSGVYRREEIIDIKSSCGEEGILRLNASILTKATGGDAGIVLNRLAVRYDIEDCSEVNL